MDDRRRCRRGYSTGTVRRDKSIFAEEQRRYNSNRMTDIPSFNEHLSITHISDLVTQRAKFILHFRERWRRKRENREM